MIYTKEDDNLSEVVNLLKSTLIFDNKILWKNINLKIKNNEFFVILGSNGSGKTSFLKVLLGLQKLSKGNVKICGKEVKRGNKNIGYIPQQKPFSSQMPLKAKDFVYLGIAGNKWGFSKQHKGQKKRIKFLLKQVGAERIANKPISLLSGGEQQRIRIAQALSTNPKLLLCDEALLSLDLNYQKIILSLINYQRIKNNIAVIFVTHEINPLLSYVDRILYLADGKFKIGLPSQVITSKVLSSIYNTKIEVLNINKKIIISGIPNSETRVNLNNNLLHSTYPCYS